MRTHPAGRTRIQNPWTRSRVTYEFVGVAIHDRPGVTLLVFLAQPEMIVFCIPYAVPVFYAKRASGQIQHVPVGQSIEEISIRDLHPVRCVVVSSDSVDLPAQGLQVVDYLSGQNVTGMNGKVTLVRQFGYSVIELSMRIRNDQELRSSHIDRYRPNLFAGCQVRVFPAHSCLEVINFPVFFLSTLLP